MGKKIAGTCFIKIDGTQLSVKGGVEVPLSKFKRENVMALDRSAGFRETAQEQFVKVTAALAPGFPLAALQSGTDMTITAELANGTVYTLSGAWLDGEPSLKGDEGEVELEFKGLDGVWQ